MTDPRDPGANYRGFVVVPIRRLAQAKQASKRKRAKKGLVLGAAGVSLAVAGGASATTPPTANVPSQDTGSRTVITLGEEEIADVNLATFYVFDKKTPEYLRRAYNLRGEVAEAVEAVEPVKSSEPAEAAAAVAVRRRELAAGARSSTLRLR